MHLLRAERMRANNHYLKLLTIVLVLFLIALIVFIIVRQSGKDEENRDGVLDNYDNELSKHKHILYILADDLGSYERLFFAIDINR
jgi:hypothetical protein